MIVSRKNIIRIFTLVVAAVLVFAGCGAGNRTAQKLGKYESPGASEDINGIVAENNKYQLLWDDAKKKVSVYDKSDGSVFSTTRHEESTELDALKALDNKVKRPANAFAYLFGTQTCQETYRG